MTFEEKMLKLEMAVRAKSPKKSIPMPKVGGFI